MSRQKAASLATPLEAVIGEIASCDETTRCCAFRIAERKQKTRRYVDQVCFDDHHQVIKIVFTDEGACRG